MLKYLQIPHVHALFYVTHDIERASNGNIDMVMFLFYTISMNGITTPQSVVYRSRELRITAKALQAAIFGFTSR